MKDKVTIILFVGILFSFSLAFLVVPDRDVSKFERRKLMSVEKLKDDFSLNLDDYMNDQFPGRDFLLSLSSFVDRKLLLNSSTNDVYMFEDSLIEKNYPLDEKSYRGFVDKLNFIDSTYLANSRVFYSLIPDKSYFLEDGYRLDFDLLGEKVRRDIDIDYIDVFDLFELEDYYRTDIHIRQTAYEKLVKKLGKAYSWNTVERNFVKKVYEPFYGATYSKVPFSQPDIIEYLVDEYTDNAKVWHLEYGDKPVYDEEAFDKVDLYDVFLSGASSLIEIENPYYEKEEELVIFRDSFGSSLTPWLIPYYKKITLVDLRYISFDNVRKYVDFEDKDVLFLYSTLVVNNSELLKVNLK